MPDWIKRTCKANGIDVHYIRTGGNKAPVVLLHGLMLNGACWTPLARSLERDYDVVMPDARGHGYSSALEHGYNYNNLATDVLCLIEALGLESPIILGHSMGGMTAAVVASQLQKQLRALILADPTFLTPERQYDVYKSDIVDKHRQILNQPKEDYLAERRARDNRPQEMIELFAQARFQTNIHAFDILRPPYPEYTHLMKTLDVPSLLIIGDVGSVVTAEMATSLTGITQRLETMQIANAGHAVPFDQPERFSAVVQTFLNRWQPVNF